MSTEWKPGDLAVCIADNWCRCGRPDCGMKTLAPKKEQLLRVRAVHIVLDNRYLAFEGAPAIYFWSASAFRKVKPDTQAADDALWVGQLQNLRRKETA